MPTLNPGTILHSALDAAAGHHLTATSTGPVPPVQHEFVIHNLQTELGALLPEARIVYGTYGTLNAAERQHQCKLGGCQFACTKIGSVKPNGAISTLDHPMRERCCGNSETPVREDSISPLR